MTLLGISNNYNSFKKLSFIYHFLIFLSYNILLLDLAEWKTGPNQNNLGIF